MNFWTLYRYLNLFILTVDLICAIWVFNEPRKNNPYKYRRVCTYLGQAVCFMILLSPPTSMLILPGCVIGYGMIFLEMHLSRKDMPYSNRRFHDWFMTKKKRHRQRRRK